MAYTKATIQGNIRYNENLVNSYQNSLQQLNEKINQLQSLKGRLQSCQNDFYSRERARSSQVGNGIFSNHPQFFNSFISGMRSLIDGGEFWHKYNALSDAINRVELEIRNLINQANSCSNDLKYRQNRINYWQRQLRYAKR